MKIKKTPSQARLLELFNYKPDTGIVTRKIVVSGSKTKIGGSLSSKTDDGYLRVQVDCKRYRLHRIIWKMVHGSFDETMQVDHINGIRSDNRLSNLRLVIPRDNNKNCKIFSHNTSGNSGVIWNKLQNKWVAYIGGSKKRNHLGYFTHIEDAIKARKEAEVLHGYHPNHGRS